MRQHGGCAHRLPRLAHSWARAWVSRVKKAGHWALFGEANKSQVNGLSMIENLSKASPWSAYSSSSKDNLGKTGVSRGLGATVPSWPRHGRKGRDEASASLWRPREACLPSFGSILLETTTTAQRGFSTVGSVRFGVGTIRGQLGPRSSYNGSRHKGHVFPRRAHRRKQGARNSWRHRVVPSSSSGSGRLRYLPRGRNEGCRETPFATSFPFPFPVGSRWGTEGHPKRDP
eukprot:scaffold1310_cov355-Pavlova_lutheri.AAC.1